MITQGAAGLEIDAERVERGGMYSLGEVDIAVSFFSRTFDC
jgi:hypothetical protein